MLCNSCKNKIKRGEGIANTCHVCGKRTHKNRPSLNCTKKSADGFNVCRQCIKEGLVITNIKSEHLLESIYRIDKPNELYTKLNNHIKTNTGGFIIMYSDGYRYWFENEAFKNSDECIDTLQEKGYELHKGKYIFKKDNILGDIYKISQL